MPWVEDLELSLLAIAPIRLSRWPHTAFRTSRNMKTPEAWPSGSAAILVQSPQLAATCTQRVSSGAQVVLDVVGVPCIGSDLKSRWAKFNELRQLDWGNRCGGFEIHAQILVCACDRIAFEMLKPENQQVATAGRVRDDNRDGAFHPLAVETRMGFLQRIAIPAGYVRSCIRATDFMSHLKCEMKPINALVAWGLDLID